MANYRILFLALFAILVVRNNAAIFSDILRPISFGQPTTVEMSLAEKNLYGAIDVAFQLLRLNSDTLIGVVVPITQISNGTQDSSKYYTCTVHMKNSSGIIYGFNAPEYLRIREESGIQQLCPHAEDSFTNYHCEHAVLLVDELHWEKSENGMILYYLSNVKGVDIIGHDLYLNYFLSLNLTGRSLIIGGRSSNHYDIKYANTFTQILLNSASTEEIISFSNSAAKKVSVKLKAENDKIIGELAFDSSMPARLQWTDDFENVPNNTAERRWSIIGRKDMPDEIECSYSKVVELLDKRNIKILPYGNGGNEIDKDIIIDCKYNLLHPFTQYMFIGRNTRYSLIVDIKAAALTPVKDRTYSTIDLHKTSRTVIDFSSENHLNSVLSMKYSLAKPICTMEIMWTNQTVMTLDIKSTAGGGWPEIEIAAVSTFFSPVLESAVTYDDALNIHTFEATMHIDGTSLHDASQAYEEIVRRNNKWNIIAHIVLKSTQKAFAFGSPTDDTIFITDSHRLINGHNGSDTFILQDNSQEYIWINNQATDSLLDTLGVQTDYYRDVRVEKHIADHQFFPRSEFDLVVKCRKHNSSVNVVLMDYLKDKSYRHLLVFKDNEVHVILPRQWISSSKNDTDTFDLVKFIYLNSLDFFSTLEPDNYWLLLDKNQMDQIKVRVFFSRVMLWVESLNLAVVLRNFSKNGEISRKWRNKFFVIADDISDDSPGIMRATEIKKLLDRDLLTE